MTVKHTRVVGSLAVALAVVFIDTPAAQQSIYQRPVNAQATISGSHGLYDGSFTRAAPAMICGVIPKEASITGEAVFVIEFPDALPVTTPGAINSIAFGSKELAASGQASAFSLSIAVVTAKGSRPAAYVLNTDSARPKNTGAATLTTQGTSTTLKVLGQNDAGETIDLTVTCR